MAQTTVEQLVSLLVEALAPLLVPIEAEVIALAAQVDQVSAAVKDLEEWAQVTYENGIRVVGGEGR